MEAYPISRWETRALEMSPPTELRRCSRGRGKAAAPFGSTRYSSHVLMRRTV